MVNQFEHEERRKWNYAWVGFCKWGQQKSRSLWGSLWKESTLSCRQKKVSIRLPGPMLAFDFTKRRGKMPWIFLTLELNLSRENLCECCSVCWCTQKRFTLDLTFVELLRMAYHFSLGISRWLSGKESACQCRRCAFDPWVGKIPWRRKCQPTPVFLPGKSHGQRSLVGYSPWGCKESDMTSNWTCTHLFS